MSRSITTANEYSKSLSLGLSVPVSDCSPPLWGWLTPARGEKVRRVPRPEAQSGRGLLMVFCLVLEIQLVAQEGAAGS